MYFNPENKGFLRTDMQDSYNMGNAAKQRLAIINFPIQRETWENIYSADQALCIGTIFPSLNLPYLGDRSTK